MIHNMLMTALTPLNATNEINCWYNRPFLNNWPECQVNKPTKCEEITRTIKKKSKRVRTAFTTDQLNCLEEEFLRNPYIDAKQRAILSKSSKIAERQIKVWFQNRRMKKKRQLSDSSSDCNSSSTSSPAVTSSVDKKPSSTLQQFITEASPDYEGPSYNIDVSPVAPCNIQHADDYDQYLPQIFPTYQNIQYHNEMGGYPTEYYPPAMYQYSDYGYFDNGLQPFHTTHAPQCNGIDVNRYSNDDFLWH